MLYAALLLRVLQDSGRTKKEAIHKVPYLNRATSLLVIKRFSIIDHHTPSMLRMPTRLKKY